MADDAPLMFKVWVRNETTKETCEFNGQGNSVSEALKDGWENACEDFGKSSSGAPPISKAHLSVRLPDGSHVFRSPGKFATRTPYSKEEAKEFAAPIASGDAAKTQAQLVEAGRAQYLPPRPRKGQT